MRLPAVLLALLLAWAPPAFAQRCGAEDQASLNACALRDYQAADAALNGAYREVMSRYGGDQADRKRLQTAQRAWIAFRDAECNFATAGSADGSIYPVLIADCLKELTEARTGQLRGYLDCQEGDLGCLPN